jgi:hypothetical protein
MQRRQLPNLLLRAKNLANAPLFKRPYDRTTEYCSHGKCRDKAVQATLGQTKYLPVKRVHKRQKWSRIEHTYICNNFQNVQQKKKLYASIFKKKMRFS